MDTLWLEADHRIEETTNATLSSWKYVEMDKGSNVLERVIFILLEPALHVSLHGPTAPRSHDRYYL